MSRPAEPTTRATCAVANNDDDQRERWEQLHEREREVLGPRAVDKRRREFAAGRRASHLAVIAYARSHAIPVSGRVRVEPRPHGADAGQPFALDDNGALPLCVSISHAAGRAVAWVCGQPIGVDLVALESFSEAFVQEALDETEVERWRAHAPHIDPESGVALAFAAKEAALKWLGCGLRRPLLSIRTLPEGSATAALPSRVRIELLREERAVSIRAAIRAPSSSWSGWEVAVWGQQAQ